MAEFQIKRATRSQTKLRLAFSGASFAGKTTASLVLAKGIIDAYVARGLIPASQEPRIGLIDTEHKRAQLYSHLVPFDIIELDPPYSPERYIAAIRQFETLDYQVIIVDSFSHAWMGAGGVLEMVSNSSNTNSFAAWKQGTPAHNKLMDCVMASRAHMICTMRSKTEWVTEKVMNRAGKEVSQPRRIGMKPIQRDGVEFEFTTLLDLQIQPDKSRSIIIQKDNTGVFDTVAIHKPEDWAAAGEAMIGWMLGGAVVAEQPKEESPEESAAVLVVAFERRAPSIETMPDLQRAFVAAYKVVGEYESDLGSEAVDMLRTRIVKAKDMRKRALSAVESAPAHDFVPVTADDVDNIESLMTLAGLHGIEFKEVFGINRYAMLPYDRYEEAITWIIQHAGAEGIELKRPARVQREPTPPSITNPAGTVLERIAASKPSLFNQPSTG